MKNGRMPAKEKTTTMTKGAIWNTTPGAMRRKTPGRRSQWRAKTTPLHLPHLALSRHPQEAPKIRGLPGRRSTSHPRQQFRRPQREASPSAPSCPWRATSLCPTGGRRWRCSHPAAAWGVRAHWNPPAWRPAHPRRRRKRSRRWRAKLSSPMNLLSHRKRRTQVEYLSPVVSISALSPLDFLFLTFSLLFLLLLFYVQKTLKPSRLWWCQNQSLFPQTPPLHRHRTPPQLKFLAPPSLRSARLPWR